MNQPIAAPLTPEAMRVLILEAKIRAEIEEHQRRAPWFAHVAACAARGDV